METKQKEKLINQLQDLITINYDAEEGYKTASEEVKSKALGDFFEVYSKQRYEFGHDIKQKLHSLNAEISKGTSIGGDLRNSWIKIKSFFTGHDDDAMIEACLDLEKAVIAEYDDVLRDEELSSDTRNMLQDHKKKIQEAVERINKLHDITEE